MLKVIEIMWLIIAVLSLIVFVYLLVSEGFVAGKAWTYLISLAVGAGMYFLRRRQRLHRQSK